MQGLAFKLLLILRGLIMMCDFSFCHAETDFGNYWNFEFEVAMRNQSLPCKAFLYCKNLVADDVLRLGYTFGFSNAKKSLPCKALHLNCWCGKHSEALSWYVHFHSAMRKFIAQFHKMCAFSFCHAETDLSSFPNLEFEVAMHNWSLLCKAFL